MEQVGGGGAAEGWWWPQFLLTARRGQPRFSSGAVEAGRSFNCSPGPAEPACLGYSCRGSQSWEMLGIQEAQDNSNFKEILESYV